MALQEEQVREALKQVIDPELFVNIVDLGLIYVVDVVAVDGDEEKFNVNIEMTMTSPMCPAGPQLVAETKKYAGEMDGVDDVEVKVVMDPSWTQDMMSDDARDQLGIF
ncbi:MAG: metal-sulfur cluster assembly factor [Mariniblastus sp.]|nr:metal-sulfur cluster assembly factor [Mariniblastus sp.]